MSKIKEHISSKLKSGFQKSGFELTNITFEHPKDEKFGDISSNAAMSLAKQHKKNPRDIANQILSNIELPDEYISKAEIAGAGFINFFISDDYYRAELKEVLSKDKNFGRSIKNSGKTANLEWVSANPTGPLHTGHGRGTSLGKAVANLIEWSGYKLTREYYYNNAGKQMETLAKSVYARYRQIFETDYPFPEDGYVGEYVKEIAAELFKEHDDKLVDSDNTIFQTAGENWCFKAIRQTLERLGIHHDVFYNESSLYDSGKIKEALEEFKKKNLSYEKDDAVWLKTSELIKDRKDVQDKVIVKSTGEPTYRLPDMTYHIDKIKRGYDLIVDIFGSDHGDTYKEVLAGVQGLGYDSSKIKVIIHQMVTFIQDGQVAKMSKRADNVYSLDDLLDDVGVDVAQFFFVMRTVNTHLDFDINLAKEQSEKNPVFYLQYAHARIAGILRNAEQVFNVTAESLKEDSANYNLLTNPDEIKLMKALSLFPEIVEIAAETFEPHKIITYLNETAEAFHKFYHNNRVINVEEKELSLQRIELCKAAKIVLRNGFEIIGITAPDRM